MGQKIHPYGLRLGIVTDWKSRWYSDKDYASNVNQDHQIRSYLRRELKRGALARIDIERIGNAKVQVDVHTARPGVVIGRGGVRGGAAPLRAGEAHQTARSSSTSSRCRTPSWTPPCSPAASPTSWRAGSPSAGP